MVVAAQAITGPGGFYALYAADAAYEIRRRGWNIGRVLRRLGRSEAKSVVAVHAP